LTAGLFLVVLFIVIAGEWLGLFEAITRLIPWPVGLLIVLVGGYPIFRNVIRAAWRREVIAHTLMTTGVVAALLVGEWVTAVVVVFFMRVGEYVETFSAERARRAVKDLTLLAPQTARILQDGQEIERPIDQVKVNDTVIVRPGEKIPVDGEVIAGKATVDQSTITGESIPVAVETGSQVYAATFAQLGALHIRATQVGADSTFGQVIRLVEEAEMHKGEVQRLADRFTAYYLPLVAGIAALTFLISRDPLATAAVLVVACSCSIALATPIAMLASIGAAARSGLMIKGGKYLELLARADVLLIDKTGTLTAGRPVVTDVISLNGLNQAELLGLAAAAEKYSEHPLARSVLDEAVARRLTVLEPSAFESLPGRGVQATVSDREITVGSSRLMDVGANDDRIVALEQEGKTLLYIGLDRELAGLIAVRDSLRPEAFEALTRVRQARIKHIELLTGDNDRVAAALAAELGIDFRANLLPEDKIAVVKAYQQKGHTVIMVGDGVNDAPALAQADIGIAMGAAGTDIASEAAHVVLMRDDWQLVPQLLQIAQRTMGVVRLNLAFTGVYNFLGLTLAAFGILPPILAAAAQSLPDLGILANSSRLISKGRRT
jgi:Cd2+/Zn2+-exporting ATPase/Cu+-exporting ATPase